MFITELKCDPVTHHVSTIRTGHHFTMLSAYKFHAYIVQYYLLSTGRVNPLIENKGDLIALSIAGVKSDPSIMTLLRSVERRADRLRRTDGLRRTIEIDTQKQLKSTIIDTS